MGALKLRYPIKGGVFQNEQDILTVFNYIYSKLEIKSEEIKEHPILITEPILSLWSSGYKSGVILESGEGVTQCCVVYEGYSIPHSYIRQDFAGRHVTEHLQTLLKKLGYSFSTTAEVEIVKRVKESLCYSMISNNPSDESKRLNETAQTLYTLPDGSYISLKEEKVLAPEILFNPSITGTEFIGNLFKFSFS